MLALSLLSGCAAAGAGQPTRLADGGPAASGPRLAETRAAARALQTAPQSASDATAGPLPGDAGAFLTGRAAGQQGDLDVAATAFLDILAHDPGNLDVRQQAFLACLLIGRPEAASLALGLPGNPMAELLLGGRDAKRDDWTGAEHRFATLQSRGVTEILQPLLVAWAQAGAGRTDQALATLQPFEAANRFRGVYLFHAALIADLGQRDPEAGRLYTLARAEFPQPNLAVSQAEASWAARHGDAAGAERVLQALIASAPDLALVLPGLRRNVAQPPVRSAVTGMAEAYVALAASLQGQSAAELSALTLRLALDLRPELTGARLLAAEIDEQAHRAPAALASLQSIGVDDPLAPLADLRRAALLARLNRGAEALAVLDRLAGAAPDRPEPWLLRADIMRRQHRYDEAVAASSEAIARVKQARPEDWSMFFQRGVASERAGHWPAAEADFNHALVLSPEQPSVLNYLGYSWTEQGHDVVRARQMIERAAALRPNDGAILDSLGWVMLRQGDAAGAVRNLERAVELEPEDATINGHLGDAYLAAHRPREATFEWRRALTLNPDTAEQARITARLHEAGDPAPRVGSSAATPTQP